MSVAAIVTAIAGIAQAGASIAGGIMQNKQIDEANKTMLEQYEQERRDRLASEMRSYGLSKSNLALSRQSLALQQQEAKLAREERAEERGYNRLQNAGNKFADFLNQKSTLTANRLAPLMRR